MAAYRVLVVEDNREVGRMVTASIKTLDGEIDVLDVPSAEEALLISTTLPLDLVVLDIRLPGMSGLEMVAKLRKHSPETKIILVTGVVDEAIRQQVAEADVEAYFFKPIEIATFLDVVKRSLQPAPGEAGQPFINEDQVAPIPPAKGVVRVATDTNVVAEAARLVPTQTLSECLAGLKQQVKAASAILVNDTGQILEEAGNAVEIRTGSDLLPALMHAFRASLQVSQAMAKGTSESLQYFVAPRQCVYVTPVGFNHALFVVTSGFFGPDKLGMIYHATHLAVRELETILANNAAEEKIRQAEVDRLHAELSAEIAVDPETLAGVEDMFSKASKIGGVEHADGFWESVANEDALAGGRGKDALSYTQAHDMGLAPDEDKGA